MPAAAGNWELAARYQQKLSAILRVLRDFGVFPAFTALLNARGIPGNYCPAPMRPLDDTRRAALLATPIVAELLAATGVFFIRCSPLDAALQIAGPKARPHLDGFAGDIPREAGPGLIRDLVAANVDIHEARWITPTLEEVFLSKTGGAA